MTNKGLSKDISSLLIHFQSLKQPCFQTRAIRPLLITMINKNHLRLPLLQSNHFCRGRCSVNPFDQRKLHVHILCGVKILFIYRYPN